MDKLKITKRELKRIIQEELSFLIEYIPQQGELEIRGAFEDLVNKSRDQDFKKASMKILKIINDDQKMKDEFSKLRDEQKADLFLRLLTDFVVMEDPQIDNIEEAEVKKKFEQNKKQIMSGVDSVDIDTGKIFVKGVLHPEDLEADSKFKKEYEQLYNSLKETK